jgi:hypothetical protein
LSGYFNQTAKDAKIASITVNPGRRYAFAPLFAATYSPRLASIPLDFLASLAVQIRPV